MKLTIVRLSAVFWIIVGAGGTALSQDHNYVPGWADTYNHRHRSSGEGRSELPGESELMGRLRSQGPSARCAIDAIEQSDRNVLVNRYRRDERRNGEAAAFRAASAAVSAHGARLQQQGRCR